MLFVRCTTRSHESRVQEFRLNYFAPLMDEVFGELLQVLCALFSRVWFCEVLVPIDVVRNMQHALVGISIR